MNEPDESLEREAHEESNAISKCQIHLCELQVNSRGDDFCEMCRNESDQRMQEIDNETLGEP